MIIVFSLLFTVIVLLLVGSVMILMRQGKINAVSHVAHVASLYAAEAGVADAVERLNDDNTWAPNDYKVTLPNGKGSYRIRFGGPVKTRSINNLFAGGTAAGPHGADTVPRTSVFLVVEGFAYGESRVVETVLNATPFRSLNGPFVTSGKIELNGDIEVVGVKAFNNWSPVEAGIHSNLSGSVRDVITWEGASGQSARIDGEITASSISPDAINMNSSGRGSYYSRLEESGVSARKFPRINVEKIVERAQDRGLTTHTPTVGTNKLRGGEYHFNGGVINGDLVLDNANLYVSGDLKVNGSITGDGSVFILGDTTFAGSAEVNVVRGGHVAIYSQGHVQLKGFDGSEFLDAAATSDPTTFDNPIRATQRALRKLQDEIGNGSGGGQNFGLPGSDVDQLRQVLGDAPSSSADLPPGFSMSDTNSVPRLISGLNSLSSTAAPDERKTIQFLQNKLRRMQILTDNKVRRVGDDYEYTRMSDVEAYLRTGEARPGLLDYVNDYNGSNANIRKARRLLAAEFQSIDFNALGSSYFKGLIFTSGAFHSTNDIEVYGGIFAQRSSKSPQDSLEVDGNFYNPGDTVLSNGCKVTYVKELVENPASATSRSLVVPVTWLVPGK